MRLMSFALTTPQIVAQTKDVTRRAGWLHLKEGQQVQPVKKCMGLRPGEAIAKIGLPLVVGKVTREPLRTMLDDPAYGADECRREGFPEMTPAEFVAMFCKTHQGCTPETVITRIQFTYILF